MLRIIVPGDEIYDEISQTFDTVNDVVLELEHSLISLSKWESKHQKPFLTNAKKAPEEILDYIYAMVLTPEVDPKVYSRLTHNNFDQINEYVESKQTATTFGQMPERTGRGEVVTAELIYFWMLTFNIPFECQYWHLNRLFALIRICNIKNSKQRKMTKGEIAARNREINAQRRAELNTNG